MPDRIFFGTGLGRRLETTSQDACYLESLGYDFLFMGEHVMQGAPPLPSGMAIPVLSVAAGATERVRLMSSTLLLPLYHPVMLAKLLSSLDCASGGRLDVGVGVGGEVAVEFQAIGVPVKERGARANEALEIIRRLWTQEHVTYRGSFYQFQDVTLSPPPIQNPHPPIWVGGRREAAMRRAARFGDGWIPYLYSPEQLRDSIRCIKEFAEQEGRDWAHFQWGVILFAALAGSQEEGLETAVRVLGRRYHSKGDWREIVSRYCLLGTPDDCVRRLQEYVDSGATHIGIQPVGDVEGEHAEVLATQVLSRFR